MKWLVRLSQRSDSEGQDEAVRILARCPTDRVTRLKQVELHISALELRLSDIRDDFRLIPVFGALGVAVATLGGDTFPALTPVLLALTVFGVIGVSSWYVLLRRRDQTIFLQLKAEALRLR